MILVWSGVFLIALKLLAVGPFAELSWWWVALPFGVAFLWFEVLESALGFDRRSRQSDEIDEARRKRIAERFRPVKDDPDGQRRT
jgi:small Trp-rich protein